ncbi:MAG: hypothetical protein HRT72_09475 [Flavobacteriales bacterium]|nr:hypothetical protein [Flavobacteriales bacterium]
MSAPTQTIGQNITNIKFGKGLKVMAADSSMSLKFQFRMQHLFEAQQGLGDGDEFESNYLVRRSRLKFSGHVLDPKVTYKVELGLSNRDMSVNKEDGNGRGASRLILDALLKYKYAKHWSVWVGQTKLPGNRERVISSANLQFVNRSNVNSKFNLDRDMGLQLHGKYTLGERFVIKPKFAWTMGEGRDITEGNFGGYNYTGRLDILPMGEFEGKKQDYVSASIVRQSKPKLALGATANYNDGAVRQQGQLGSFVYDSTGVYAENSLFSLQFDAMFKYKGLSWMTEYAVTSADKKMDGLSKNYNTGWGFNTQLGYQFENNIEIAGRYTSIKPDDSNYSGINEVDEYTLGFSKYFVGHNLKIQSDISYIDNIGSNADVRFRLQVEMQF